MKKILLTATVQSHICQFHLPIMKMLKEEGNEVHVAAKNNLDEKNGLQIKFADEIFNIPFSRSPISKKNITAYKELKNIIDKENYDIIHCNTPVGGVITRLAARNSRKKGTRVIYTAHGFHFYKGAPLINWIIYYPIEKCMAHLTDVLVTITKEDYLLAKKYNFKTQVEHIYGSGVDRARFECINQDEKQQLRHTLGFNDEFIILCTGELNRNKNQETVIRAIKCVIDKYPNTKLLLAGNGAREVNLKALVNQLDLNDKVVFLGYRNDIEKFVKISDLIASASFREGMPFNIIEGMICGKPVIASQNRGHKELIKNGQTGILVDAGEYNEVEEVICNLYGNNDKLNYLGFNAKKEIMPYCSENVSIQLKKIYGI
jgi:glycosyltransferase EpsD